MNKEIDIKIPVKEDVKVLTDESFGEKIRRENDLDTLDKDDTVIVNIHIPDHILGVTSTFTRGLFGKSVENLGTVTAVLHRYNIIASDIMGVHMREKIALVGLLDNFSNKESQDLLRELIGKEPEHKNRWWNMDLLGVIALIYLLIAGAMNLYNNGPCI